MKRRKTIEFTDHNGDVVKSVELVESSSRGNKHFNCRRPDGPVCGAVNETIDRRTGKVVSSWTCMEPWQALCPNYQCVAARTVRHVERVERGVDSRKAQIDDGKVLDVLDGFYRRFGSATGFKEIKRAVGATDDTVLELALDRLVGQGQVVKVERRYMIVPDRELAVSA